MSNKKGHPKVTFLAIQYRGFPIGLNSVRVFVQSFCANFNNDPETTVYGGA